MGTGNVKIFACGAILIEIWLILYEFVCYKIAPKARNFLGTKKSCGPLPFAQVAPLSRSRSMRPKRFLVSVFKWCPPFLCKDSNTHMAFDGIHIYYVSAVISFRPMVMSLTRKLCPRRGRGVFDGTRSSFRINFHSLE